MSKACWWNIHLQIMMQDDITYEQVQDWLTRTFIIVPGDYLHVEKCSLTLPERFKSWLKGCV